MRKGAHSRDAIAPEILFDLNTGRIATATLAECLAINHAALMQSVVPGCDADFMSALEGAAGAGITRRMALAADLLLARHGVGATLRLAGKTSDTVRGWAAFMIGRAPNLTLADRFARLRPLADDGHFAVREWAWLAVRPHIAADIEHSIELLGPWIEATSPYLRRFAVEGTRPRGVWSAHVPALKRNPSLGLPLLEPLKADLELYVQDSVANWINDAAKDQPDWARKLCARWIGESPLAATNRICKRAVRSIRVS